jgi:uncharacterized secreted protein with C-terminal beta-propeller domain
MRFDWRRLVVLGSLTMVFSACSDEPLLEIGPRNRSSASLRTVDSCDDLLHALRANVKEQMRVQLLQQLDGYEDGPVALRGGFAEDTAAAAPNAEGGRQEGVDYSTTNNQETGVDEADFVKFDGYYLYVVNGNRLEIVSVPEFGALVPTATAVIEGYPSQIMVAGSQVVVFSAVDPWQLPVGHPLRTTMTQNGRSSMDVGWWGIGNITKITVLDVTDHATPVVSKEIYVEGYYQTARKVQSSVRMLSYAWMEIPGLETWIEVPETCWYSDLFTGDCEDQLRSATLAAIRHNNRVISAAPLSTFVPQIYERSASGVITEHVLTDADCAGFALAQDAASRGFTSIISMDLLTETFAYQATHVLSNQPVVYASTDTLVLVEPAQDWWWYWNNDDFDEATNVHRFDISQPGTAVYTGSGRIDGSVLNQFAVSELDGNIRLASTTGQWNRWWMSDPEPSENHVVVLAGESSLATVGRLDGIASGERIWSARFTGDRAFLVTFRNMDPLWTIDLSDPTNPQIIGELEVPGVSTYIHPIDDDHLLSIGFGGDSMGLDWSTQVSLFDVSDFAAPALTDVQPLSEPGGDGWVWSWSEANYEHKAFQYWNPRNLLAVPVSTYRYSYTSYEYYTRLELLSVAAGAGLASYGAVDHSSYYGGINDGYWYSPEVRRSIFMGDFIVAISDRAITAHRIDDLSLAAAVALPGSPWGYGWY